MNISTSTPLFRCVSRVSAGLLQLHVVEDHDEALPLIHRAIATKQLPFSCTALIHFDAHPDLLSPDIKADEIIDKENLYSHTSIAEWILPAVYMGHFNSVVWLKPPWATQMPEGRHSLIVGKDKTTGRIRLATPLPYFIGELLYVPESELVNIRNIPLLVVTLTPLSPCSTRQPGSLLATTTEFSDAEPSTMVPGERTCHKVEDVLFEKSSLCDHTEVVPTYAHKDSQSDIPTKNSGNGTVISPSSLDFNTSTKINAIDYQNDVDISPPAAKVPKIDSENGPIIDNQICPSNGRTRVAYTPRAVVEQLATIICESEAWLLDIDLDFFSTGNPYRGPFTDEQYDLLRRLYQLADSNKPFNEQSALDCVEKRRQMLDLLQGVWSTNCRMDQPIMKDCFQLTSHDLDLLTAMKKFLGTTHKNALIDEEYLHLSGMLTDLPVHSSTENEICALVQATISLLKSVGETTSKPPSLITVARSSDDDYTPLLQVEYIQDLVLSHLGQLYSAETKLSIKYKYFDKRDRFYETPRDVCDCSYL